MTEQSPELKAMFKAYFDEKFKPREPIYGFEIGRIYTNYVGDRYRIIKKNGTYWYAEEVGTGRCGDFNRYGHLDGRPSHDSLVPKKLKESK